MPELPEVETIRAGLAPHLAKNVIQSVVVRNSRLRYPVAPCFCTDLSGKVITQLTRRGKYLLFHFDQGGLLWHLGLSGSLQLLSKNQATKKHDHIDIVMRSHCLRFNDPRRFGFVLWVDNFESQPFLQRLGPEPLSQDFSARYLHKRLRNKCIPIKQAMMDHTLVAGVGNIYASEACYYAKLAPTLSARQLTLKQCQKLVCAIQDVLKAAIQAGGTSLKDFVDSEGRPGYFKQQLFVYGRVDQPCRSCHQPIQKIVINQRSTFFCPSCQK